MAALLGVERMEWTIPFFDTKVYTDDLGKSGKNVAGAILGGVSLLAIIAAAKGVYERGTNAAGVDGGNPVEGV